MLGPGSQIFKSRLRVTTSNTDDDDDQPIFKFMVIADQPSSLADLFVWSEKSAIAGLLVASTTSDSES